VLELAALPTAVTVGLEVAGWAEPSNAARAVVGLPLGLGVGYVLALAVGGGLQATAPRGPMPPRAS